jgi:hypothetical protein
LQLIVKAQSQLGVWEWYILFFALFLLVLFSNPSFTSSYKFICIVINQCLLKSRY